MLIDGVASAATVTCAANDQVIVRAVSTTQFKLSRVKYDGTAQVAAGASVVRSARTTNTILAAADNGTLIDITSGTFSQTFTDATTLGSGWWCYYRNSGTDVVTLDPAAAELIDGATTLIMYPGDVRLVQCTGTAFTTVRIEAGIGNNCAMLETGNGYGTTDLYTRRYVTIKQNTGTAITYADSAANGTTFTINEPGIYILTQVDRNTTGPVAIGMTVNASAGELSGAGSPVNVSSAHSIGFVNNMDTANGWATLTATYLAAAGDIIRPHGSNNANSTSTREATFSIRKIAHV